MYTITSLASFIIFGLSNRFLFEFQVAFISLFCLSDLSYIEDFCCFRKSCDGKSLHITGGWEKGGAAETQLSL